MDTGTGTARRPRRTDEAVCRAAAERLAPEVARWLEEAPDESIVAALTKALRGNSDGYALARALERDWHIEPDEELVEILSGAAGALWSCQDAAIAAWVAENGVTLGLDIGTRVSTPRGMGVVERRDEKLANYIIRLDPPDPNCKGFPIVPAENVIPIEQGGLIHVGREANH